MINTLFQLYYLLTPNERRQARLLLFLILMMALFDVIGIASIMPFMAILANPNLIETQSYLAAIYKGLKFFSPQAFLFFLGIVVFALLVASLAFKALTSYMQLQFGLLREYTISVRLIEGYLHQPYTWFLNRNSANLGQNILSEVGTVVGHGMLPMMTLIAQSVVVLALLVLWIVVDPTLAFSVLGVLGFSYALIFVFISPFLSRIGRERGEANERRFTVISEAFGAIKELKIGGLERDYIKRFSEPAEIYARHQASAQAFSQLPRFLLEAVAFGGMLLIMLSFMSSKEGFNAMVPIMAVYVFAGYRLMPALQQIYGSLSQLRFVGEAVKLLYDDVTALRLDQNVEIPEGAIEFSKCIELKDIDFSYAGSKNCALKNINLQISANTTIGIVGATGGGKTTLVDLFLGLLEPQKGDIVIDGVVLSPASLRQWQRMIGYVPQQIYLADDTIAANIAFGVPTEEIDLLAVKRAARVANLHNFVENDLEKSYSTIIGERGIRLSGGQRQRIGIARALYHNPKILVMDEATSALDNLTELAVMDAVGNLEHEITIVLIAHRLSTVRKCDCIYLLEDGQIKAQGTYDELLEKNALFKKMAKN